MLDLYAEHWPSLAVELPPGVPFEPPTIRTLAAFIGADVGQPGIQANSPLSALVDDYRPGTR